jgi:hypothetical protein
MSGIAGLPGTGYFGTTRPGVWEPPPIEPIYGINPPPVVPPQDDMGPYSHPTLPYYPQAPVDSSLPDATMPYDPYYPVAPTDHLNQGIGAPQLQTQNLNMPQYLADYQASVDAAGAAAGGNSGGGGYTGGGGNYTPPAVTPPAPALAGGSTVDTSATHAPAAPAMHTWAVPNMATGVDDYGVESWSYMSLPEGVTPDGKSYNVQQNTVYGYDYTTSPYRNLSTWNYDNSDRMNDLARARQLESLGLTSDPVYMGAKIQGLL